MGYTPLHNACNKGSLDVVQLLIDNGAVVNVFDKVKYFNNFIDLTD